MQEKLSLSFTAEMTAITLALEHAAENWPQMTVLIHTDSLSAVQRLRAGPENRETNVEGTSGNSSKREARGAGE